MSDDSNDLWPGIVRALARELARELGPALADALKGTPTGERPREEGGETFLNVSETCKRFQISRATFDRMLRDTSNGLSEVIVRLPPTTGRVKVPLLAFQAWLHERRQKRRRGRGGEA